MTDVKVHLRDQSRALVEVWRRYFRGAHRYFYSSQRPGPDWRCKCSEKDVRDLAWLIAEIGEAA